MINQLPLIKTAYVYHAGDLTQPITNDRPYSQEGACLSVSHCPLDWCRIAKLPVKYIHTLRRDTEFVLLDMQLAYKDDDLRSEVINWAREEGLVEEKVRWRAWYFDSEADEWRHYTCATKEDADVEVSEVLEYLEEGDATAPPGHNMVEPVVLWVSTPKLATRMRQAKYGDVDAFDFAMIAWAEDNLPQLDGVWWNQPYDPFSLTAPRGGLFQRVLPKCIIDTATIDKWSPSPSAGVDGDLQSSMSCGPV